MDIPGPEQKDAHAVINVMRPSEATTRKYQADADAQNMLGGNEMPSSTSVQRSILVPSEKTIKNSLQSANKAPLAKFEYLESALTSTLGTHVRCTTVPHLTGTQRASVSTANKKASLPQASSLHTLSQTSPSSSSHNLETEATQTSTSDLLTTAPSGLRTILFHVGTPPAHFSDSASQTEAISARDPLEQMISPTTSFESDGELQVLHQLSFTFSFPSIKEHEFFIIFIFAIFLCCKLCHFNMTLYLKLNTWLHA